MFKKNWNIIIVLLIIVLSIAFYCNNYEGFAGSLDAKNAEAIANVASLYNKDNLTLTNLTATNRINIPRNSKISYSEIGNPNNYTIGWSNDNGIDGLQVKSWGGGEFDVFADDDKSKRILWWNKGGVGMTDLYSNNINNGGKANLKDTQITGRLDILGGASGGTHFPWTDGWNYIRGNTRVDGAFQINGVDVKQELDKLRKDLDDRTKWVIWAYGHSAPPGYSGNVGGGTKIDNNGHPQWAVRN